MDDDEQSRRRSPEQMLQELAASDPEAARALTAQLERAGTAWQPPQPEPQPSLGEQLQQAGTTFSRFGSFEQVSNEHSALLPSQSLPSYRDVTDYRTGQPEFTALTVPEADTASEPQFAGTDARIAVVAEQTQPVTSLEQTREITKTIEQDQEVEAMRGTDARTGVAAEQPEPEQESPSEAERTKEQEQDTRER